jgi:hypothetical protein
MKGAGLDLFFASIVFIAVILIISLAAFGVISVEAFQGTCEKELNSRINSWLDKISFSTAQPFNDRLIVGSCVEFINEEGVVWDGKSESDVKKYSIKNADDLFLTFQFENFEEDTKKIFPRENYYNVTIDPNGTVIVYEGNLPEVPKAPIPRVRGR